MSEAEVPASPTGDKRVSLKDALSCVLQLNSIPLPLDEDPDINAPDSPVTYNANRDAKFADRGTYEQAARKYIEEAVQQVKLVSLSLILAVPRTHSQTPYHAFVPYSYK